MKSCPHCQHDNDSVATFCHTCGHRLTLATPKGSKVVVIATVIGVAALLAMLLLVAASPTFDEPAADSIQSVETSGTYDVDVRVE